MIELIVIISILSILVLLASVYLIGRTDSARLAQITHDVRQAETLTSIHLLENEELPGDWHNVDMRDLGIAHSEGELYSKEGVAESITQGDYKIIDEDFINREVGSRLNGDFYVNKGGNVYYQDNNVEGTPELDDMPDDYETAEDFEFTWIVDDDAPLSEVRDEEGYYQYQGDKEYIVIPETIQDEEITHYYKMFSSGSGPNVKGVASESKDVNYMGKMFMNFPGDELDIRHLRTQDVDSSHEMFANVNINELDMRYFDFDSLESSVLMFNHANINEIIIPAFSAPKLEDAYGMFKGFITHNPVDLSYVDTPELRGIHEMFANAILDDVTLTGMNIPKVVNGFGAFMNSKMNTFEWINSTARELHNFNQMFRGSESVSIDLSGSHFPTFRDGYGMFEEAKANKINLDNFVISDDLITLDGRAQEPQFNQAFMNSVVSEISMVNAELHNLDRSGGYGMFQYMTSDSVNLTNIQIHGNENFNEWFHWSNITGEVKLVNVDFSNADDMFGMFHGLSADSVEIKDSDISTVRSSGGNMNNAFAESNIRSVNIEDVTFHSSRDVALMFENSNIDNLTIKNVDMLNLGNSYGMFMDSDINELKIENFHASNDANEARANKWFSNSNIESLSMNGIDLPTTENLHGFFKNASINELAIDNFDVPNANHMPEMFQDATIPYVDFTQFETGKVWSMGSMFNNATIDNIDLSSFDLSSLEDANNMFANVTTDLIDVSSLVGSELTSTSRMFMDSDVNEIDISNLDTSTQNFDIDDTIYTPITTDMFTNTTANVIYIRSQGDIDRLESEEMEANPPETVEFQIR